MPQKRRIGDTMGKLFGWFNKQGEPAADFDTDYDNVYYNDNANGVGVEDGDDVRVVLSTETVEEAATLLKRTFTPVSYEECRDIVEAYKDGRVVVICVEELDKANFVRLFDYLMGAVQALDGELRRIDRETVVLLPADYDEDISIDELDEEIIEEIEEEEEDSKDID